MGGWGRGRVGHTGREATCVGRAAAQGSPGRRRQPGCPHLPPHTPAHPTAHPQKKAIRLRLPPSAAQHALGRAPAEARRARGRGGQAPARPPAHAAGPVPRRAAGDAPTHPAHANMPSLQTPALWRRCAAGLSACSAAQQAQRHTQHAAARTQPSKPRCSASAASICATAAGCWNACRTSCPCSSKITRGTMRGPGWACAGEAGSSVRLGPPPRR